MTKTVLITGCSTGLGKLTARHFAAQGWNVIATMRKPEPSLAEEFPDRVLVAALDVADSWSIEAAVQAGVGRFGGIDAVVNNAGITILSILEATPEKRHPEDLRDQCLRRDERDARDRARAAPARRRHDRQRDIRGGLHGGAAAVALRGVETCGRRPVGVALLRAESQNIRMKLVEPGAMRATNFTASGMAASEEAPVPEKLPGLFRPRAEVDDRLSVRRDRRASGGRDGFPGRDRRDLAAALSDRAGRGGVCAAALVDLGGRIPHRDEPAHRTDGVAGEGKVTLRLAVIRREPCNLKRRRARSGSLPASLAE